MKCPKCGQFDNFRVVRTLKTHEGDSKKLECLNPQCGHTWLVVIVNPFEVINGIPVAHKVKK